MRQVKFPEMIKRLQTFLETPEHMRHEETILDRGEFCWDWSNTGFIGLCLSCRDVIKDFDDYNVNEGKCRKCMMKETWHK